MESWEDRLRNEAAELDERYSKLNAFIGGATYKLMGEEDQMLLLAQLSAMNTYLGILVMRLNRINES